MAANNINNAPGDSCFVKVGKVILQNDAPGDSYSVKVGEGILHIGGAERLQDGPSDGDIKSKFSMQNYGNTILKGLHQSWKQENYCDVTLKVEDRTVKAHKLVLAAMSEYFKALLMHTEADVSKDEILLHHVSFSAVCELLQFGYSGECTITRKSVQDLFIAADYLQVPAVRAACEHFLLKNLDVENCVDMHQFAVTYSCKELEEGTLDFIGKEFECVSRTDSFSTLPFEVLLKILQNDQLLLFRKGMPLPSVTREQCLLIGVLWYISQAKVASVKAKQLLETVRLPFIEKHVVEKEFAAVFPDFETNDLKKVVDLADRVRSHELVPPSKDIPSFWLEERGLSGLSVFKSRRRYANEGHVRPVVASFDDSDKMRMDDRLEAIKIFVRLWDGRRVIGGLSVTYRNGKTFHYGLEGTHEACVDTYSFTLGEDEVITKITLRSGWLIDALSFSTSEGNEYGSYGGTGGNQHTAVCTSRSGSYLLSFFGSEVMTQGSKGITKLGFAWVCFGDEKPVEETFEDLWGFGDDDVEYTGSEDYDYTDEEDEEEENEEAEEEDYHSEDDIY